MDSSFYVKQLICIVIFRVIAQMGPEDSWVAKWQRIGKITYS